MNYLKIQNQILKGAMARDIRDIQFEYTLEDNGDNILVIFGGHGIWVIPKTRWYINTDKTFGFDESTLARDLIAKADIAESLEDTKTLKELESGLYVVLKSGDETIYLNKDHLSMFEKAGISYKGTDKNHIVYIYEFDELVGAVMPRRDQDEENG